SDICRDFVWLRRVVAGGGSAWGKIDAATAVYEIPDLDGLTTVWEFYPALDEIATAEALVVQGSPRLTAALVKCWPHGLVSKFLQSVQGEVLVKSAKAVDYLARFLDESADDSVWSVHAEDLVNLCGSMLFNIRSDIAAETRAAIRRFLGRLPSER